MAHKKALISIIIPTKNRQFYARKAVEQILAESDERIEVVIQDNSDDDGLWNELSAFWEDSRLIYHYHKGLLSFVDNFSMAVSLSTGEYVCMIGDDDGINPQIADIAEWAMEHKVDAIKPETSAVYFWPHSESVSGREDNGYMTVHKITGSVRVCDPKQEVKKLLEQGGLKYLSLNMVKLYHGIVRREYLELVKEKTGYYFGGLSPDIYISVALSLLVPKLICVDYPLTISGICNKSGSADSATGRHTGRLEDAPHFRGHESYSWAARVPRFYSVETIWADSALAAIQDIKQEKLADSFNQVALRQHCNKNYPNYVKIMKENAVQEKKLAPLVEGKLRIIYGKRILLDIARRGKHRLFLRKSDLIRVNGVSDILQANDILQKRFIELGFGHERVEKLLEKVWKN